MPRRLDVGDTLDDAGRPVKLLDPAYGSEWPIGSDKRLAALANRLKLAASDKFRFAVVPFILLPLGVGVLLGLLAVNGNSSLARWIRLTLALASLPWAFVSYAIIARSRRRRFAERIKAIVLDEGMCAACGYNLFGLGGRPDLVTCPECGARWQGSRIARSSETVGRAGIIRAADVLIDPEVETGLDDVDDRGSPCSLASPRLRVPLPEANSDLDRRRLAFARRAISVHGRHVRVPIGLALILAAAGAAALLWRYTAHMTFAVVAPFLAITGVLGGAVLCGLIVRKRDIKSALLEHSLCPSCASPLDSILPDPHDSCTVCTTCRCAWKLPPPAAPAPSATLPP